MGFRVEFSGAVINEGVSWTPGLQPAATGPRSLLSVFLPRAEPGRLRKSHRIHLLSQQCNLLLQCCLAAVCRVHG